MAKEKDQQQGKEAITSQADAARYCNVTIRTIRNKEKDYPLKDGRGNYIPEQLDRYVRAAISEKKGSLKEKSLFADLDLKDKKSKLAQWDLDLRAGKYVLVDDVERQSVSRITEARRILLSLPRSLPAQLRGLDDRSMIGVIQEQVYRCLDILAGQKVAPPDNPVAEVMEYFQLLDKKDRARFKELLGNRHIKNQTSKGKIKESPAAMEENIIHHEDTKGHEEK